MATSTYPVPAARRLLWVAAGAGLLHAAASAYWALGGEALLSTVGPWAVEAAREGGGRTALLLALVAVLKASAALIPVAVEHGRVGGRRIWRAVSAAGGAGLVLYGGVNTVVALLVLGGVVQPAGGYDHDAMLGHAFLWDPLFLLWGAALLGALRVSRASGAPASAGPAPGAGGAGAASAGARG